MFKCMPFLCNRHVDYINKSHGNLSSVPDEVLRYSRSLEELLLDFNQIKVLPRGLFRLTQLRKLSVSNNFIARLSLDIGSLVNLIELNISRNELEELPEEIKLCKELQVLELTGNPLQRLPDGFTKLQCLTHLGLSETMLTRLPVDFGSLINLETLELRENLLKYLPTSMSKLGKLRILDLGDNMIEELPDAIGQLTNLEELRLDSNELSQLPKLSNLKKLTQLDLYENKLEKLPADIGDLMLLTDLLLSKNQIETLPESIGNLENLIILKADQNQLLAMPDSIGNCHCLQELILTENLLSELPPTIGLLKSLTHLNVDKNRLRELPDEIGDCCQLNVLSLRDNQVGYLPSSIGTLQQLHILDVSENRLHHLPLELGQCNLKAIWLSENQTQAMLKFQEDVDEETGFKVLTCFLLPQQAYHTESMENLLQGSIATEHDSQSSWNGEHIRTAVRFVGEEDMDSDIDDNEETNFVRHDTPHPKDLRTRYNKLLKKNDVDGRVIPRNPDKTKENVSFVPSREYHGDEMKESPSRKSGMPEGTRVSIQVTPPTKATVSIIVPEVTVTSAEDTSGSVAEKVTDAVAEQSDSDGGVNEESAPVPKAVNTADSDEECDDGRPRRVGFALSEDFAEKEGRLRRRDTPHHLKNKRIGKAESEVEKVRRILAQVAAGQHSVSATSDDSERSASVKDDANDRRVHYEENDDGEEEEGAVFNSEPENDDVEEHTNLLRAGRRSPPPVRFSVDNSEDVPEDPVTSAEQSPVQPVQNSVFQSVCEGEEEMVIKILREPGVGLGISIAGGVGSTPYKGTDPGVFISRINAGGPCEQAGLRVGDKLITVNGQNMVGINHYEAVGVLREAGNNITMEIVRKIEEPPQKCIEQKQFIEKNPLPMPSSPVKTLTPSQTIVTTLRRDRSGLGFNIAGGRGTIPYKANDESVFISKIAEGGAAARDGKLRAGDQLISINGFDVTSAQHDEVVALLTSNAEELTIVVYRENMLGEPSPNHNALHIGVPTISVAPTTAHSVSPTPAPRDSSRHSTSPIIGFTPLTSPASLQRVTSPSSFSFTQPPALGSTSPSSSSPRTLMHVQLSSSLASPSTTKPPSTRTITYSIGETAKIEPPMPVMTFSDKPVADRVSPQPVDKKHQAVPEAHLLFVTPPPPPQPNTLPSSGGVNELFEAIEQDYMRSPSSPVGMAARAQNSIQASQRALPASTGHDDSPVETVVMTKAAGPLGFSVVGGIDHTCHPFGRDKPGIFISKIVPNGPAAKTRLQFGDRIHRVNGRDMSRATHQEAVRCLTAPGHEVVLDVQHEPPLPGLQEVEVLRRPCEKLGMSIRGGSKSRSGNPLDKTDEGIFISKVLSVGAVHRTGKLRVGQRILEVHGESLLGLTHQEAVNILRSVPDRFSILVCDGFDPSLLDAETGPSMKSCNSLSSIDCDAEEYARKEAQRLVQQRGLPVAGSGSLSFNSSFETSPSVAVHHSFLYEPSLPSPSASGMSAAGSPLTEIEISSPGCSSRAISRPPVAPKSWKSPQPAAVNLQDTNQVCTPHSDGSRLQPSLSPGGQHNGAELAGDHTDGHFPDPVRQSKLPAARPKIPAALMQTSPKPAAAAVDNETMAFNMKKRFFEKEIEQAHAASFDHGKIPTSQTSGARMKNDDSFPVFAYDDNLTS